MNENKISHEKPCCYYYENESTTTITPSCGCFCHLPPSPERSVVPLCSKEIRTQAKVEVIEKIREWAKKEIAANPLHNLFDLDDFLNKI